jgi:transcriptional regulator with XRE-family HTH domain
VTPSATESDMKAPERGPSVCPTGHKHGLTGTCYQRHACRCPSCKAGRARDERNRVTRARAGLTQEFVPSITLVSHLMELRGEGWKYADIEAVSGVSVPSISRIMRGVTANVERETADAILGTLPHMRLRAPEARRIDPTGTRRRLQALVAMGWTFWELSARMGHARTWALNVTRSGTVTRKTRDTVAALYEELWHAEPPQSTTVERSSYRRSRTLAKRHGWPGPLGWDDIDTDPEPEEEGPTQTPGESLLEDVAWLLDSGESPLVVAHRLGRKPGSIAKLAARNGDADLATLFYAADNSAKVAA